MTKAEAIAHCRSVAADLLARADRIEDSPRRDNLLKLAARYNLDADEMSSECEPVPTKTHEKPTETCASPEVHCWGCGCC